MNLFDLEYGDLFKWKYDLNTIYELVSVTETGEATVIRVARKNTDHWQSIPGAEKENANPYGEITTALD